MSNSPHLSHLSITNMAQSSPSSTKGLRSLFTKNKSPEPTLQKDQRSIGEMRDGKRTRPPSPGQTKRNIRLARLPPIQRGQDGKWQPPSLSRGSISTSALTAYASGPNVSSVTPVTPLSEAHYNIRLSISFIIKSLKPVIRGSGFLASHAEMHKIAEDRLSLLERVERNWGTAWSAMAAGAANADAIKSARVGERQKDRERKAMVDALRDGILLCFLFNHLLPHQPPFIPRVNISDDGLVRATNVNRFIAACQANDLECFVVTDLQAGTESGLGTVAKTVLAIARQHPPVRSPVIRPQVHGDVITSPAASRVASPTSIERISSRPSSDIAGLACPLQSGMDITPPSSGFVAQPITPAKIRQSLPLPISPIGSRASTPTALFPSGRPPIRPRTSALQGDPGGHHRERTPSLVGSAAYTRTSTAFSDETEIEDRIQTRLWHRRDSEQTLQHARQRLGSLLSIDDLADARGQAIDQSLRTLEGRNSPRRPVPRRGHTTEGSGDRLSEADEDSSGGSRKRRPSMLKRASTKGKMYVPKRIASPTRQCSPRASTIAASHLQEGGITLSFDEPGQGLTRYQLGNCVGKGQFGSVYRSLNLGTGQMAAIKRIRLEGMKEAEVRDVMKEVDLLKRLAHPSIVKYEGMSRDEDYLNIVLEFVENGSLGQTIKSFGVFNEQLASSYVGKILQGLDYLHSQGVVHCDLKAANILSTKNGNIKLSDFGVSLNMKAVENIKQDVQTHGKAAPNIGDVAGTPHWMAPEVISLNGASPASDIWSLGCTIIELLTGKPPYADITNSMSVLFRIVEDDAVPLPPVTPELENLLRMCFIKNPTRRPTAAKLAEHVWLQADGVLRPQDSVPYLRRVSARANSSDVFASEGLPQPEHSFVKTSFGSAIPCRICHTSVKKVGVLCQACGLIAHPSCVYRSSTRCTIEQTTFQPPKLVPPKPVRKEERRSVIRDKREGKSDCNIM